MITLPPRFFDICKACGIAELHGAPLPEVCPKCGKPWGHGRRLRDGDWQVKLVGRALLRHCRQAAESASGRWWGLDAAGKAFCQRVMDACCADRWHYTKAYGMAVALVNATNNAERARATRSTSAHDRYRKRVVKDLDTFHLTLKSLGI
jgi:hypothetical protein